MSIIIFLLLLNNKSNKTNNKYLPQNYSAWRLIFSQLAAYYEFNYYSRTETFEKLLSTADILHSDFT